MPAPVATTLPADTTAAAIPPVAGTTTPTATGVIDPAAYQKRTEFDNAPWRFNMEQDGRRMTADEFSAWMEARGVRVARGPAPHRPENPTSDGMPAQGSAMPMGAAAVTTQVASPAPAPQPPVAPVQAMPATTPLPVTTSALDVPPTGLAPGSVTPSDAWKGVDPVPAAAVVPTPATASPPPEGEQAQ